QDGHTALDVAARSQDRELAALVADYSSRPRPWTLWQLKRCILPQWSSTSCRGAQSVEGGSLATSRGVELDLKAADDPQHLFASDGLREEAPSPPSPLAAVLDEARRREGCGEQGGQDCPLGGGEGADCEIEWHGLEPVLVERRRARDGLASAGKQGKAGLEATDDFSTAATASPSNLSGRLSHDTPQSHWGGATASRASPSGPPQATAPAAADRRAPAPLAGLASGARTSPRAAALGSPAALRPEGAPPL
ncbi:unnamed protein product, partial [Prorocentrum cordatum]